MLIAMIESINRIFPTAIKINIIIIIIVTLIAPYNTGDIGFFTRLIYWGVLVMTSWYAWMMIELFIARKLEVHYFIIVSLSTFLMTFPLLLMIVLLDLLLLNAGFAGLALFYFWAGLVLTTQCISTLIYFIIHTIKNQNDTGETLDNCPHFLKNIAGDLLYIKSEDHYLRICTNVEEKLILYKLKDAIKQLELSQIEGMMTHRSYWVAKEAIKQSEKQGRKYFLILNNDTQLPISATYLKPLKIAAYI